MTLANFNSNFNWQLRALKQATECCGVVPNLPPTPPPAQNCWCGTFVYTKAGISPVDIKEVGINGQPPVVPLLFPNNIFDPSFPTVFATYLNGLYPDSNISVAVTQTSYQNFIMCISGVDDNFTFDSLVLGQLVGFVPFSLNALCPAVNRGSLTITFNSDSELIGFYALDPATAIPLQWNNLLGLDSSANPVTFTYSSWDPGTMTVTLYGAVDLLTFSTSFIGFTTIVSISDNEGYYDTLPMNAFQFSWLTSAYFAKAKFISDYAFSYMVLPVSVSMPEINYIGQYAFDSTPLSSLNISTANIIDTGAFQFTNLQTLSVPSCVSVGAFAFQGTPLYNIDLSSCTNLGGTPLDDSVFFGIAPAGIGTFTFNSVLSTINAGLPDGDIDYVTVNYPGVITVAYV